MLGSAAHELRTPVGHIKGFVSTLRAVKGRSGQARQFGPARPEQRNTSRIHDVARGRAIG